MLARLTAVTLAVAAALCLGVPGPARAAWVNSGVGPAAQAAITMPTGATPTVTVADVLGVGMVYTLSWPTTDLYTGRPVTGYRITRTATLGGTALGLGSCSGVAVVGLGFPVYVPADADAGARVQSCTDVSAVPLGAVRYSITPVYSRWVGLASAWSAPVG